MLRLQPTQRAPLFSQDATRRIEESAKAALPPYTLMQRAGEATARLARALAPHARDIWVACGGGNNGGDGLEAALHLHQSGCRVRVTWLGTPDHLPADALRAWERARAAGVAFVDTPPAQADLCIDALLGLGLTSAERPVNPRLRDCLDALHTHAALVLCIDLPSGLLADTGQYAPGLAPCTPPRSTRHTLSLLTLKPGLFTGTGRDAAGTVWFDDLGVAADAKPPCAWLPGAPQPAPRLHASHKGSYGDVAVVGGSAGMAGAALLAASAALRGGAGRVFAAPLDGGLALDVTQPELMLRRFDALDMAQSTVVCGCGGGEAVQAVLPQVLAQAPRLVLDADALNAIAAAPALQRQLAERTGPTVLTPHPLEAARLLHTTTDQVQAQRLQAAQQLADRFRCAVALKGSGTVIAAPGCVPAINPTGNALLATAGTGDVLAGLTGARLAAGLSAFDAACAACWRHGHVADTWPADQALTASALARRLSA
ncbi:MAG: NAD(P)H-hydrate dehydratase [Acidovorax sp.]